MSSSTRPGSPARSCRTCLNGVTIRSEMKLGLTSSTLRDPGVLLREGDPPPSSAVRTKGAQVPSEPPMLERVKRERNSLETKRRILEAATAEFAAKGFDGARLGSIARTA